MKLTVRQLLALINGMGKDTIVRLQIRSFRMKHVIIITTSDDAVDGIANT